MSSIGVTLLSGGLDSTVVTTYALSRVHQLSALTFHYGQTHSKEVHCAQSIAQLLSIEHHLVDISFLSKVAWYSALTSPERFPLPVGRPLESIGFGVPITYVPLRNTLFLALAAAFLESKVLYAIEVEGAHPQDIEAHVFMGPNALDSSGYPDCRPEFFEKARETLLYGSKLWTQYHLPLQIQTPIIDLTKGDIIRLGMQLEAPLEHTWSCYQGKETPCGQCDSCILRAKGFQEAGYPDPLLLRLAREPKGA